MSEAHPIYLRRMLAELAEAILRQEYGKDLHNIALLRALEDGNADAAIKAWCDRWEQPWHEE